MTPDVCLINPAMIFSNVVFPGTIMSNQSSDRIFFDREESHLTPFFTIGFAYVIPINDLHSSPPPP